MSPGLIAFIRLAHLGFLIGGYGTLVGAGGGSLLVPALLILMPNESPANLTSISLAVVFFNAYSGTVAYMRMRRIDYYAGVLFALAGVPGAVLGTILVREIPRDLFDPIFGVLLLVASVYLAFYPLSSEEPSEHGEPRAEQIHFGRGNRAPVMLVGAVGSAYIAVLSSLLGIGGGIIHVPFLIRVLRMPAHTATATSHFVLSFMALAATVTHILAGAFESQPGAPHSPVSQTMYLAVGVMM